MLDLNRVVGLIFHSHSHVFFHEVQQVLMPITAQFEPDDVGIVFNDFCQGSGPVTAAIGNAKKLLNEVDFITTVKAVSKEIGSAELNSPKIVFIISDTFSNDLCWTITKLHRINQSYDYPATIKSIQVHPLAICDQPDLNLTIVSNMDGLQKEIINQLSELEVASESET